MVIVMITLISVDDANRELYIKLYEKVCMHVQHINFKILFNAVGENQEVLQTP